MSHPFRDKIVVFIGKPTRCTRQEARDALFAVGGIIDENISTFVNYVVAFRDAEKTKKYKKRRIANHLSQLSAKKSFLMSSKAGQTRPNSRKATKGL